MSGSDVTIEVLREIRDELRGVRAEVHALRTDAGQRVEGVSQRLDLIETTLLDLAGQNRLVVRYTKAVADRQGRAGPPGEGGEPAAK